MDAAPVRVAARCQRQEVPAVDHELVYFRAGALRELHRATGARRQRQTRRLRVRQDRAVSRVLASSHAGVRVLTLNEPPANTYSYEMMRELDAAILDARMDRDISVIVMTGAGEKFFCAGATIGMLKEAT